MRMGWEMILTASAPPVSPTRRPIPKSWAAGIGTSKLSTSSCIRFDMEVVLVLKILCERARMPNSQPMLCCGWQFLMGSRIPGCSWLWFFAVTKPMLVLSWRLNDDERQGTPGWAYCTVHIYIYISVRQMLKTASKNCQGKNLWQVGTATLCCVFWICLDPSPNTILWLCLQAPLPSSPHC